MKGLLNIKKNIFLYLLIVIILFGSWLRISGIMSNSFAFTYDVGRDLLSVDTMISTHKPLLIGQTTGLAGIFYGPWWYYVLTPIFILSAGNPQGIALFIALSGITCIILAYILGRKLSSNSLGILFAFLVAISASLIGISTQIWNPNIIPCVLCGILLIINKIYDTKRNDSLYPFLLGFLLGLILDFEIVFGTLFFIGILLSLVFIIKKKKILFLYVFAGFFVTLLPRIIFELKHNFLMSRFLLTLFTHPSGKEVGISFHPENMMAVWAIFKDTLGGGSDIYSLILVGICIYISFRYYKIFQTKEKLFFNLSLTIISVFLVFLSFFLREAWSHFLIGLPILFILVVSICIHAFMKVFPKAQIGVILLLLILFIINMNQIKFFESFKNTYWEGDASVYRNQLSIIDYVYKKAHGKPFNYQLYTPPLHDYTYAYLFKWYGKQKYSYTPSEKTQKLFFFILEPDYQNPYIHNDWLKVREGDGKVITDTVLKAKIRVQTRIR